MATEVYQFLNIINQFRTLIGLIQSKRQHQSGFYVKERSPYIMNVYEHNFTIEILDRKAMSERVWDYFEIGSLH